MTICRFPQGYHFGNLKLDVKTKTGSGVEFKSEASSNVDTGKVKGSLETKYKVKDYGLTLTEKWNTDNNLSATLDVQDQIFKVGRSKNQEMYCIALFFNLTTMYVV